jgi:high-affinity iron transporter
MDYIHSERSIVLKIYRLSIVWLLIFLLIPSSLYAKSSDIDIVQANAYVNQALQDTQKGDLKTAKEHYELYHTGWYQFEDVVKKKSQGVYRAIEDQMGQIEFAFAQQPPNSDAIIKSLQGLEEINTNVINGNLSLYQQSDSASKGKTNVADVVALLDQALANIKQNNVAEAKGNIQKFRESWLDIEGVVLTQSNKIYLDAERDMVSSYAMLSAKPPDTAGAERTIKNMKNYLEPLSGKTTYTILDVITILMREGLEAILVVVALLGFLKKSGHEDKKKWIWYGLGSGLLVSTILGVIVQLLFSSGAFGNNNFLIAGCTGVFAAVMLLYMSYWLHSKSSLGSWHKYINQKSTGALATGSLWSLAILSFLAVFREGTETVLFFIGMASSIALGTLLMGIAVGVAILALLAFLILKVGLKIPMRPFFLVSSILVFYLCFKFLGMGVHGLQLAGVLNASQIQELPTIDFLAIYATWENIIPQAILLLLAIVTVLWSRKRDNTLKKQLKM